MGLRLKLVLLVLFFVLVSWCLHLISYLFEFAETLEKVEFSDLVLVLRTTWHFLLAAFLDFFVTLSVFPSLFGLTVRLLLIKVLKLRTLILALNLNLMLPVFQEKRVICFLQHGR